MDIQPPDGTSFWTLGAGAVGSLLYLRKFLSRQGVDIKKDSAESNLIQTLQAERDKAMAAAEKAWETRAEDAKLIGELTSEVRSSRELIEQLRKQVAEMKTEFEAMYHQLRTTGYGPTTPTA